ncbi:hypothetical protein LTR59_011010 [Friedmanniomyces endolithicus]|nr:hypothetical protein LTR94_015790 [Friedmanniomyces endolithicus]KAK0785443.1 hypothetical protein LTR59_011010 [Friedmanniomyces endolithicus]KAK0811369.1 hypothetical protein LTR38_003697 [Friedmanniomyces endolithicus]KAK0817908.1 hypothetical protein LTR75_002837 [Friedmanniomyces endolithicus]KAK0836766.1 hypothetical protein LTR03_013394 [Friedmanniomyces endolithicus]
MVTAVDRFAAWRGREVSSRIAGRSRVAPPTLVRKRIAGPARQTSRGKVVDRKIDEFAKVTKGVKEGKGGMSAKGLKRKRSGTMPLQESSPVLAESLGPRTPLQTAEVSGGDDDPGETRARAARSIESPSDRLEPQAPETQQATSGESDQDAVDPVTPLEAVHGIQRSLRAESVPVKDQFSDERIEFLDLAMSDQILRDDAWLVTLSRHRTFSADTQPWDNASSTETLSDIDESQVPELAEALDRETLLFEDVPSSTGWEVQRPALPIIRSSNAYEHEEPPEQTEPFAEALGVAHSVTSPRFVEVLKAMEELTLGEHDTLPDFGDVVTTRSHPSIDGEPLPSSASESTHSAGVRRSSRKRIEASLFTGLVRSPEGDTLAHSSGSSESAEDPDAVSEQSAPPPSKRRKIAARSGVIGLNSTPSNTGKATLVVVLKVKADIDHLLLARLKAVAGNPKKRGSAKPSRSKQQRLDTTPAVSKTISQTALAHLGYESKITAIPTPPSSPADDSRQALLSTIDPQLIDLSQALTHREPVGSKPQPRGEPKVWADSRQALYETVPYFKKPQGGCHANDKHVYAFLFDGIGHCREYMDTDIIIARAGGGMESDSSGSMVQGKDQSMSTSQVQAMLNDIELQNPLVIICGDKNTGALSQMPHMYSILGWYKPTMVWAEKTAGKGKKSLTTIKYRLERLARSDPWHAPVVTPTYDTAVAGPLLTKICSACSQSHPQLYLESWMCLNPACGRFWKLEDGEEAPCGNLLYNPAFLLDRTPWQNEEEPYSVVPSFPDIGKTIGDNLTYINTRGVVCPLCGRCNSRYLFKGWRCDRPGCSWEGLWPQHQPIVPAALHTPWGSSGYGPALGRNKHESGVDVSVRYTHNYKVYTYTFLGIEGSFIHAVANNRVREEARGPDDMLAELQTADMGLERRRFGGERMAGTKQSKAPLASPQQSLTAPGGLLTPITETSPELDLPTLDTTTDNTAKAPEVIDGDFMTAFSMNYGMPYKFVASGTTRSFDDEKTPWPIPECRSRLIWAADQFLPSSSSSSKTDLNELLVFAYMEGQKIEYHDDGEEGLGPTIASLSLGGTAKMHLRLKTKHFVGCSKSGLLTPERPVPGSLEYEKRLQLWEEIQPLKETNRAEYLKRIKAIPREVGVYEKRNKNAGDLVTVSLGHGDVMVMHGYAIQRYLEHKVVPEGHLRFTLTCRAVLEGHLKEWERPGYGVEGDGIGYDGEGIR